MGFNISGSVVKADISNALDELSEVFDAELEFDKEVPIDDYISYVPAEDEVVIAVQNGATLLIYDGFHRVDRALQLQNKFNHDISSYIASETSMAFIFEHQREGKQYTDNYLFESEFIQEGPNLLELTEESDVVWDGIFTLIHEWTGIQGYGNDLMAKLYKLKEKAKVAKTETSQATASIYDRPFFKTDNDDLILYYYQLQMGHYNRSQFSDPEKALTQVEAELKSRGLSTQQLYNHHSGAASFKEKIRDRSKSDLDIMSSSIRSKLNGGNMKNPHEIIALKIMSDVRPYARDDRQTTSGGGYSTARMVALIVIATIILIAMFFYIYENY